VPRTAHPSPSFSDTYSYVKYWVKNALAANPANYTTAAQLQTLVDGLVSPGQLVRRCPELPEQRLEHEPSLHHHGG